MTAEIALLLDRERATYESMTDEQKALVAEARNIASSYATQFVDRTREADEMRRRLRSFAATWHTAIGHDYSLDDCSWSTCLELLTGRMRDGDALRERVGELPL